MESRFAFAYLRVSTADQTVENQRMQIEKYSLKREIPVREDGWFEDPATSGKVPPLKRDGFKELFETLAAMKLAGDPLPSCVYVYEVSRWGRTFRETLEAIWAIEETSMIISTSSKESFLQYDDRSMRNLFLSILAWAAERERFVLIERTNAGVARAHSEGKHSGKIPLGYSLVDGKLTKDPRGERVKSLLSLNPRLKAIQVQKELGILKYKEAYDLLTSVKKFG